MALNHRAQWHAKQARAVSDSSAPASTLRLPETSGGVLKRRAPEQGLLDSASVAELERRELSARGELVDDADLARPELGDALGGKSLDPLAATPSERSSAPEQPKAGLFPAGQSAPLEADEEVVDDEEDPALAEFDDRDDEIDLDIDVGSGDDDDDDDDDDDSDDDDDDDSDDDEAEIARELEKIRREREEEARRKQVEDEELAARLAATGNPLLRGAGGPAATGGLKRRWDADVVFAHQSRSEPKKAKRFINDTIRNDFHRSFLKRYIT